MPLMEYLQVFGNFNSEYVTTGLYNSGHFDNFNLNTTDLSTKVTELTTGNRESLRSKKSGASYQTYDLIFRPPSGILNSKLPLLPNTELIISFDRAISDLSLISKVADMDSDILGTALDLKNVSLKARYYSTPYLRNYFESIREQDITYKYDEIVVYHKSIPTNETIIRLNNIIGGNTPQYLFAGIIESKALVGHSEFSSTCFKHHNVVEFDLTLNGTSCNGFPLTSQDSSPINVYEKYLETTGRKFQNLCAGLIEPSDFVKFHYLYSHKFNVESNDGWLGINLKLSQVFKENMVLVIWTVYDVEMKVDRFKRIEKSII